MKRDYSFGALPPDYAAWQEGKTAASIRFVRDASIALQNQSLEFVDRKILQEGIEMIKSGEVTFHTWVTPEEWISQVKNVK